MAQVLRSLAEELQRLHVCRKMRPTPSLVGRYISAAVGTTLALVVISFAPRTGRAEASPKPVPEDAWLSALADRLAADARQGRPIVVHAHVALCDNRIIRCGGHGLGNGDDPAKNLYWATSGGVKGWFGRRASGWTRLTGARRATEDTTRDVLDIAVYRRRVAPSPSYRARGVLKPFDVYVVAEAWRGTAIDTMLETYVSELYGSRAVTFEAGGVRLAAGGAAHVVAYLGHNRWMDRPPYDFVAAERTAEGPPKGTIAIACKSADDLAAHVPSAARVPLVMTTDFLFAGAHSFEGAVRALAEGGNLARIRAEATRAYAEGQRKPVGRVRRAFTNPSDPAWRRRQPPASR